MTDGTKKETRIFVRAVTIEIFYRHFDKWGKYHSRTLYTNELSYFIKFMDDDFFIFF